MAVIARSRGSVGPGTLRVLLRLSRYGLNHKRYMAGAFLALSGASATAMFIPRFLGLAIDRTVENGLERDLLVRECERRVAVPADEAAAVGGGGTWR